jgi:hypothetical protein
MQRKFSMIYFSNRILLSSSAERSATSTLLIDFDRGEILEQKDDARRLERTVCYFSDMSAPSLMSCQGTPMFMARAIRQGGPLGKDRKLLEYCGMPESSSEVYRKVFPDRLVKFPTSESFPVKINLRDDKKLWRHELYHDAESVFWLLVWWALQASPKDAEVTTTIPRWIWSTFANTTEGDGRSCDIAQYTLDPSYEPLKGLLEQLGDAVVHDLHWATVQSESEACTHPEYLHEVFQRYILNFILAKQHEDFMTLCKANEPRQPATETFISSYSSAQIDFWRPQAIMPQLGKHPRDSDLGPEAVCYYYFSSISHFSKVNALI